ncbi:MAG: multiple monosaccharide ABC transporter ATP-binding protein [Beutenbergiaceae bacterium]
MPNDNEAILEMVAITKTFPGVKALSDVTLTVARGEVHAICGENGAGKSTLMKVLSGIYPYGTYEGEISYLGGLCRFRNVRDSEHVGIVIIHQELALSPYLSIAENIFLGNEQLTGGVIDWNLTNSRAAALLQRVGLNEAPDTRIADIGVGKQQLVEIAKAMSKDVRLLILDEPTAALNDEDSAHLLSLIAQLRDEGITSIIISHKLNEIEAIADTVTIIRDGQSIESLSMHAEEPVTQDRIIRGMVGRPLESRFPERAPNVGEEVLSIEGWTVLHPIDRTRKVVDQAFLNVRRGEVVGLAGLMGAGRTELAMSLFGRSYGAQVEGHVYKDGVQIDTSSVRAAIRHGLAYVTEDRKRYGLNLIDSVQHNITLAALKQVAHLGVIDRNAESSVAEKFRTDLRIRTADVDTHAGKLSGGNQQKVVLSKWIYADPDVLILDEPTRGIDVGAKYEIYTIINRLASEGKAIIVISSELPELLGICDRIYAICEGRVTGVLDQAEATQERLMELMTMGKESR